MRPLVVVTAIPRRIETTLPGESDHATVHRRFGELVARAGGVPVTAEPAADPVELAGRADAVIINGGGDVDPAAYGAERHPRTDWVDPERDRFELGLAREAVERGVPVLGVCRGLHVLNVALGGTLIQHLPDVTELDHDVREPFERPAHEVELEPRSRLGAVYGAERLAVNTVHHQAAERLGGDLVASARADDGTIEGIESGDGRALGVQWHPELMDPSHDGEQLPAFAALIELAGR